MSIENDSIKPLHLPFRQLPLARMTVKVHLHVTKGVAEIVPTGSVKTSKEGKLTIDLVGPDAEDPNVVSIALAPGVIVPFAGYTGATIDVIITLSEKPNAFTAADHLDVTHATAADPVALDPVAEQTASEIQTRFAKAGTWRPATDAWGL